MQTYYVRVLFINLSIPTTNYDLSILLPPLYEKTEPRESELLKGTQPAIAGPASECKQRAFDIYVLNHCPLIYVKVLY